MSVQGVGGAGVMAGVGGAGVMARGGKGRFHCRVGGAGLMVKDRINQQCGCPFNGWMTEALRLIHLAIKRIKLQYSLFPSHNYMPYM